MADSQPPPGPTDGERTVPTSGPTVLKRTYSQLDLDYDVEGRPASSSSVHVVSPTERADDHTANLSADSPRHLDGDDQDRQDRKRARSASFDVNRDQVPSVTMADVAGPSTAAAAGVSDGVGDIVDPSLEAWVERPASTSGAIQDNRGRQNASAGESISTLRASSRGSPPRRAFVHRHSQRRPHFFTRDASPTAGESSTSTRQTESVSRPQSEVIMISDTESDEQPRSGGSRTVDGSRRVTFSDPSETALVRNLLVRLRRRSQASQSVARTPESSTQTSSAQRRRSQPQTLTGSGSVALRHARLIDARARTGSSPNSVLRSPAWPAVDPPPTPPPVSSAASADAPRTRNPRRPSVRPAGPYPPHIRRLLGVTEEDPQVPANLLENIDRALDLRLDPRLEEYVGHIERHRLENVATRSAVGSSSTAPSMDGAGEEFDAEDILRAVRELSEPSGDASEWAQSRDPEPVLEDDFEDLSTSNLREFVPFISPSASQNLTQDVPRSRSRASASGTSSVDAVRSLFGGLTSDGELDTTGEHDDVVHPHAIPQESEAGPSTAAHNVPTSAASSSSSGSSYATAHTSHSSPSVSSSRRRLAMPVPPSSPFRFGLPSSQPSQMNRASSQDASGSVQVQSIHRHLTMPVPPSSPFRLGSTSSQPRQMNRASSQDVSGPVQVQSTDRRLAMPVPPSSPFRLGPTSGQPSQVHRASSQGASGPVQVQSIEPTPRSTRSTLTPLAATTTPLAPPTPASRAQTELTEQEVRDIVESNQIQRSFSSLAGPSSSPTTNDGTPPSQAVFAFGRSPDVPQRRNVPHGFSFGPTNSPSAEETEESIGPSIMFPPARAEPPLMSLSELRYGTSAFVPSTAARHVLDLPPSIPRAQPPVPPPAFAFGMPGPFFQYGPSAAPAASAQSQNRAPIPDATDVSALAERVRQGEQTTAEEARALLQHFMGGLEGAVQNYVRTVVPSMGTINAATDVMAAIRQLRDSEAVDANRALMSFTPAAEYRMQAARDVRQIVHTTHGIGTLHARNAQLTAALLTSLGAPIPQSIAARASSAPGNSAVPPSYVAGPTPGLFSRGMGMPPLPLASAGQGNAGMMGGPAVDPLVLSRILSDTDLPLHSRGMFQQNAASQGAPTSDVLDMYDIDMGPSISGMPNDQNQWDRERLRRRELESQLLGEMMGLGLPSGSTSVENGVTASLESTPRSFFDSDIDRDINATFLRHVAAGRRRRRQNGANSTITQETRPRTVPSNSPNNPPRTTQPDSFYTDPFEDTPYANEAISPAPRTQAAAPVDSTARQRSGTPNTSADSAAATGSPSVQSQSRERTRIDSEPLLPRSLSRREINLNAYHDGPFRAALARTVAHQRRREERGRADTGSGTAAPRTASSAQPRTPSGPRPRVAGTSTTPSSTAATSRAAAPTQSASGRQPSSSRPSGPRDGTSAYSWLTPEEIASADRSGRAFVLTPSQAVRSFDPRNSRRRDPGNLPLTYSYSYDDDASLDTGMFAGGFAFGWQPRRTTRERSSTDDATARHFGHLPFDQGYEFDPRYREILRALRDEGGYGTRGTSQAVLDSLPSGTYGEWATPGSSEERCPICFEDYQQDDPVLRLPTCSHWFHTPCLQQWLATARTCPMCRTPVEAEPARSWTRSTSDRSRIPRTGTTVLPPAGFRFRDGVVPPQQVIPPTQGRQTQNGGRSRSSTAQGASGAGSQPPRVNAPQSAAGPSSSTATNVSAATTAASASRTTAGTGGNNRNGTSGQADQGWNWVAGDGWWQ